MELLNNLEKMGLSHQEAKIYLSCLKLENAKASKIASHANIERQAVYYTLKILIRKGFVSETIKSGIQYYSVVDPSALFGKIEEEKTIKEEALHIIEKEYQNLKGVAIPHPKIEKYEGIEGFKTIVREMIQEPNQQLYSYVPQKVAEFQPFFAESYAKKRKERKIKLKTIMENTPELRQKAKDDKKTAKETRFLDKIMKGKDYGLAISKNKVIFIRLTEKEQIGIKIEDPHFAELQTNIFKILWEQAEK